ncbi:MULTISPECIES: LacI family DNA-binding transcriptional regulator [unclassified Streptomyces]|uniref:LacI family DNA-binding transcriptional regulator n=1 Tax=unclassified Streptomyces TaxID=2593676 RepID=UPI0025B34469|nr:MULTISPECIES: LacI family DNA-binding transcriptional regulator [unclassified Streptomyces]MDN3244894.1 LacI family DNA-binding transcriptional regulator [Streptomyces sp. ZSW22]MDN3254341.1 LacI family DNA-binding transcriptional regulator [Streptomyces sp. MA25(2023)]
MATIGDVARMAGVSRSTASYALSGKRAISSDVRRRVEEAVRELGYTPNAGARALATAQTRVIGLLAQFLDDEFAPAMLQYMLGVSNSARELGYDILLTTDPDGRSALRRLTDSRMVDGIVLLNVAEHDDRLPILRAAPQPGALVGLSADCSGVDVFDLDFVQAGRLMVDHLHRLGHRELALVSHPEHVVERGGSYVWRLQNAAAEAARARGITLHAVFGASHQPDVGRDLHRLLDAHPGVTGLLINNEAAAAALPTVLHERGLEAPADLSVIGRYSDEFAHTFSLPYSSIESAPDRLGRMAVRELVRRIEGQVGPDEPHVVQLISPELVDRGSTGAPRKG